MVKNSHINKRSNKPDEKRTHVVIETNGEDLALVRLTTKKPNTTQLKFYQNGQSYFKHFVEIEDVDGGPLKVGENINQNHENMDLSKSDVSHIHTTLSNSRERQNYEKNMEKFRNRYKK